MMNYKEIKYEKTEGIAILTLNRPDIRNAITGSEIISEIESVCQDVNSDLSIKVLVITGTDPAFSSGGNIKDMAARKGMFEGTPSQLMINYRNYVQRIPKLIHSVETPVIAAVNGPAIGAGFDLTLMCDIRIASEKALFGETFLNVGLIPGDGGAYFFPRAVGMARACELTFTGETVDAAKALEYGMVNYVVAHEELMPESIKLAQKIASKPPEALRMAKRLLHMGQFLSLHHLLEQSSSMQALCHYTEDHREALSAIFEKREPQFTGK